MRLILLFSIIAVTTVDYSILKMSEDDDIFKDDIANSPWEGDEGVGYREKPYSGK